jgi:hypothetical protein
MTLAASGEMSIGGSTATRSINLELGRAAGATSSLGEAALRTLAGVASGTISMSNFYNKANFTVAYSAGFTNNYSIDDVYDGFASENASAGIRWNTNATMDQFQYSTGYSGLGETWGSPTTTSIGSNYWIRFTRTATSSFGSPTAATNSTASTGWLQLNTSREINIFRYPGQQGFSATYTVEISSDSGGATILTTRTGIQILLTDSNV